MPSKSNPKNVKSETMHVLWILEGLLLCQVVSSRGCIGLMKRHFNMEISLQWYNTKLEIQMKWLMVRGNTNYLY